jgi:argininosuccinate lyase
MEEKKSPNTKPWGGRFGSEPDPLVRDYTVSLHLDRKLARYDLQGTRAHVRMLARQGILSPEELEQIETALMKIEEEIAEGTFPYREDLEDIHMNIERRLQEIAGAAGGKVHTGRSRNDQIALDLRLFCLDTAKSWQVDLREIVAALSRRAEELRECLYPGWTHLQSAQPLSWAHYLLAYAEMFGRDHRRLDYFRQMHHVSPLGAGALAGSTLPLDPEATARFLGFPDSFRNSYDVVGDRDFILELIQVASQIMIHVSRLAEDFIYMASTPIGWIDLPDALCTGSSMMPQKKNPDVLELARGKSALVIGHAAGFCTLLKGLPSSYNRDLQQDKEHLFGTTSTVADTIHILPLVIVGFDIRHERVRPFLREGFLMATDLAEYLVRKGVPFRSAHEKVGRLVAKCVQEGLTLDEVPFEALRQMIPECAEDVAGCLNPETVLTARNHKGSTGLASIDAQLKYWKQWLNQFRIDESIEAP